MVSTLLSVENAAKNFGGVKALVKADLTLYTHEIHALLGENGAGKSTLLKTLAGVHTLDSGSITLNGKTIEQGSTRSAREQGIAVIYQEPNLFPDLTLAVIRETFSAWELFSELDGPQLREAIAEVAVRKKWFKDQRIGRGLSPMVWRIAEAAPGSPLATALNQAEAWLYA